MTEPIRILHVLGGVSLGGAESRIMDLYRCMERDKVQFDFLVHSTDAKERKPEFYDEEIKSLGGNIYVLPKFKVYNYLSYLKAVKKFFAEHHDFHMVQGHMTSTASIYLKEAKRAGVLVVAAHARSAGVDKGIKGIITKVLRRPLLKRADYCFACSTEAGRAVFGKNWENSPKAKVIPNAIDVAKFKYNREVREGVRREEELENCYVIGHVGRFHYAKNHEFLLEVFAFVHEKMNKIGMNAVLMLLGEGPGMEAVKEQARTLGIEKDVLFMGNKKEIEKYYQAMDYFVFPSRFEGLPGTVVEAQAAGLRCLISDRVTGEVALSELVHYESIDKKPDLWAEYILEHASYERRSMENTVKEAGFDVKNQAEDMKRFYMGEQM